MSGTGSIGLWELLQRAEAHCAVSGVLSVGGLQMVKAPVNTASFTGCGAREGEGLWIYADGEKLTIHSLNKAGGDYCGHLWARVLTLCKPCALKYGFIW